MPDDLQAADNLPLYGVCCYMEEMVHRPPAVLSDAYPNCNVPLSRYLVSAPRCYCFLTHFPFFTLHMKVSPSAVNHDGCKGGRVSGSSPLPRAPLHMKELKPWELHDNTRVQRTSSGNQAKLRFATSCTPPLLSAHEGAPLLGRAESPWGKLLFIG